MTDPLHAAYPVDDADLARLRARLADAAAGEGVLDVAFRTLDSPVGPLLVATTEAGLVRVAFAGEGWDGVLQTLASRISPRVLDAPARLDGVARQLEEYFAGRRRGFDVALDWQLSAGFRRTVLTHLAADVGYGSTASYAALAAAAGNARAVRAVGTACATNPIPIVVPCHRIVRSDGRPGNYLGGPQAKAMLLALEQGSH